jgi:D-sorbitol dehydrogenase-like protein
MDSLGRRAFIVSISLVSRWFAAGPRAQAFTVNDFLVLSSRLTGHQDLPRQTAGTFLNALLATPGIDRARLARPDAALEEAIVVAWYTGVHQVGGEARVVTHTGALQWRAMGKPAPGTCIGPFGTWAKPQPSAQR